MTLAHMRKEGTPGTQKWAASGQGRLTRIGWFYIELFDIERRPT